ncbi:hypothetical protein, partial [Neisseria iguanae]|uniref:hypothetical protein n=1 Tax=Neisseria iguanae TaxID=90242 RepID=UPI001B80D357
AAERAVRSNTGTEAVSLGYAFLICNGLSSFLQPIMTDNLRQPHNFSEGLSFFTARFRWFNL